MTRQAVTALAFLSVLIAYPAHAQQDRSGLSYTTRGTAPSASKSRELRIINYKQKSENEEKENAAEQSPGDRAWERYRELAAGTHKIEEEPQPEETAKEPEEKSAAPATGFAGILEQYNKNKQSRSEMRTISVFRPKTPEPPEAEKPEAPEKKDKEED